LVGSAGPCQKGNEPLSEILLSIALLAFAPPSVQAQTTLLDIGYRQMYNLQFEDAHRTFHEWERLHPDDAVGPASDAAAYLFAELDRLHVLQSEFFLHDENFATRKKLIPDPVVKQKFDEALLQSKQLADRSLEREPQNHNALFASVVRLGLHADYLALVEKRNLMSLAEVKAGRILAEKLIASDPDFGDAYLALGVENYFLSLKPAPVRWLLRMQGAETDKERGIKNISMTAERGHYLVPYARVLLAVAALRDRNTGRVRELLEGLVKEFPQNRLYAEELARLH
jgi:tetratricopeptide (TPR) repeat protein